MRRTLLALLASMLGIVPLKGLFSDWGWLPSAWLSMIVVIAPAALLRRRRAPGALDIWPGIVLLVPWLTLRFLSDTAVAGIIPTGRTWTALSQLLTQLHETTREEVAPIRTTVPVQLVICALVGLFAALIDLVAVVGRRGALAGVPLLVVFTVAGAVPRETVAWTWFVVGAAGFLLLLTLDSADLHSRWGRRIGGRPSGASGGRSGGGGSSGGGSGLAGIGAVPIAVIAIVLAVALPLLVPGEPRNLLSNAFHGNGGVDGLSGGSGSNGQINPYAALRGQLDRGEPRKLADVQMIGTSKTPPHYLRSNVLAEYSDAGWRVSSHGARESITDDDYRVESGDAPAAVQLEARIDVDGMRGNPVSFNYPERITGLPGDTGWSPTDQLLLDSSVGDDTTYTITFRQPEPTQAQLRAASDDIEPEVYSYLELPRDLPQYARNLTQRVTEGQSGQYAKARAIYDYFNDPENGFVYDLETKPGDSGSALVDFLQNKRGYCQQYAGAMGVMLREADIPARVVLGYLNSGPDAEGKFEVSTEDAHAWVEAWFEGVGWVPFDPTPAAGLPGGGGTLAWAPREGERTDGQTSSSAPSSAAPSTAQRPDATSNAPSPSASANAPQADAPSSAPAGWLVVVAVVLVVLALALLPAALRAARRRQRYQAARGSGEGSGGGSVDPLWAELIDTAADLGYVWSDARSPRQVADWLAPHLSRTADRLRILTDAVEQSRYAGTAGARGAAGTVLTRTDDLPHALRDVCAELREQRSAATRFRARFWPASLGWTVPFGTGRREL